MNDDLIPFEPEELDEILSAALDGELDAAAHDLGLSVDEVSARLQATPGADARRAELAAARELLATPVELDELVARRLQATALRAAEEVPAPARAGESSHRSQWLLRSAGIAAAIAALVAVAISLGNMSSSTSSKSSSVAEDSPAENGAAQHPTTTLGSRTLAPAQALGSFSSVHDLAQAAAVQGALSWGSATSFAPSAADAASGSTDQTALPATSTQSGAAAGTAGTKYDSAKSSERLANNGATGVGISCGAPAAVPIGATPVLHATATLAGKPVVVTVFAGNGEHIVVVQDTKCALVNVQTLD